MRTHSKLLLLVTVTAIATLFACDPERAAPEGDGSLEVVDGDALEEKEPGFRGATVEPEAPGTRVAMMIDFTSDDASPAIEARGDEGEWVPVVITWREGTLAVGAVDLPGPASRAEWRVTDEDAAGLATVRWALVTPAEEEDAGDDEGPAVELNQVVQGLSADLSELGVRSRASWGARSSRCQSTDPNKYRMAVHHTVTRQAGSLAGGNARMRQMQAYHMDGRGWCDIGYHFVVDEAGRLYEARRLDLGGAHVAYSNSGNIGVSWMGCYHPTTCGAAGSHAVTEPMIDAGGRLLHHLALRYGISRSSSTVKGHRDHANVNKACPGDRLAARLGDLRSWAPTPDLTPPTWPAGSALTRAAASGGTVLLSWPAAGDDTGVDHYRIEAGGRSATSASTSGVINGLLPYAEYDFAVRPVDGAGRVGAPLVAHFATGPFSDIAGTFANAIEVLARARITVGCNPPANDHFCPADTVTRAQMATFLTRALGLPAGPNAFVDDEGSSHEASINSIAAAGITLGCNPPQNDRFCPSAPVTREQMATFLARALDLPAGPDAFVDDEGSSHEGSINSIAAAGITVGCGPGLYCPTDPVTRAQLAAFLTRAFDL